VAVAGWWVVPLIRPRGVYARCYHIFDLEIGVVAALIWWGWWAISAAPPRWRRPLALRLATVCGAMVLATVACDVFSVVWNARVRHFWYYGQSFPYSAHTFDPEYIWKFRPGFGYRGRANPFSHDMIFRTDENGFRNGPGVRQADLVFLGDSVTMAAEVPEEATFVQRTSQALGRSAVNLGVFCYGPQQELAVLKRFGLAYAPRVVVWQVTEWNDCQDAERYARRDHPESPHVRPWLEVYETFSPVVAGLAKVFRPRGAKFWTDRRLVLFRRSDGLVEHRLIWPFDPGGATSPTGLEETKRSIAAAHALCRARGIAFVVLFVPSHTRVLGPYVLPRSPAERDRYAAPGGVDRPSGMTGGLAEHCRRLGCPMIDLYPALSRAAAVNNVQVYIKHDPHLDLDGHDAAAHQLVQLLRSQGPLALPVDGVWAGARAAQR
jgi:hypothetical protein